MQATVHRKIWVLEYAPIAIFRYFLQKTNIVVNSKAKAFDNTTASLRIIISQRNRFFKPKQLSTVLCLLRLRYARSAERLNLMSQTLAPGKQIKSSSA
jgi:hypothetical protein